MNTLNNWFVVGEGESRRLIGEVTGSEVYPDGYRIRTSTVASCKGRYATTASGTRYRLGKIDEAYKATLTAYKAFTPLG